MQLAPPITGSTFDISGPDTDGKAASCAFSDNLAADETLQHTLIIITITIPPTLICFSQRTYHSVSYCH